MQHLPTITPKHHKTPSRKKRRKWRKRPTDEWCKLDRRLFQHTAISQHCRFICFNPQRWHPNASVVALQQLFSIPKHSAAPPTASFFYSLLPQAMRPLSFFFPPLPSSPPPPFLMHLSSILCILPSSVFHDSHCILPPNFGHVFSRTLDHPSGRTLQSNSFSEAMPHHIAVHLLRLFFFLPYCSYLVKAMDSAKAIPCKAHWHDNTTAAC